MNEVLNVVSWDKATNLGKVSGSEWVCPTGDLEAIGAIHNIGKCINDEDVRVMADGRRQHLTLIQFPEGYHAVHIIDTDTGRILTDAKHTKRYVGFATSRTATHCSPGTVGFLLGQPINLDGGKQITSVENLTGSVHTTLQPIQGTTYDYSLALSRINISPQARELDMIVAGKIGGLDLAMFNVRETNSKVTGTLAIPLTKGGVRGRINLDLNAEGQAEKLTVSKSGSLQLLGLHIGTDSPSEKNDQQAVTDPDQQNLALDVAAEALGFGSWKGLDLKATAAGLYAAMGRRDIDLGKYIRSR